MGLLDTLVAKPPPIREDAGGVLRVGCTRVRLDTVVTAYKMGCSPEDILRKYPSLQLAEIHAVIAYYLSHTAEVEAYLADRERIAEAARREDEARFPPAGLRERLMARPGESGEPVGQGCGRKPKSSEKGLLCLFIDSRE